MKDKTIHNPYHITSETAFYSGLPIYDWENDEFEGDTFLNALSIIQKENEN
jgi:hypothetical protein